MMECEENIVQRNTAGVNRSEISLLPISLAFSLNVSALYLKR